MKTVVCKISKPSTRNQSLIGVVGGRSVSDVEIRAVDNNNCRLRTLMRLASVFFTGAIMSQPLEPLTESIGGWRYIEFKR